MILPRYPIYIPSKGRSESCATADCLVADGVPFDLVVEKEELDLYAAKYGRRRCQVLPFSNAGSVIPARNWIKEHATKCGFARHWQLDDNMKEFLRIYANRRIRVPAGVALRVTEDFVDRYENIAVAGLNYRMFFAGAKRAPFYVNQHVYSCSLVLNSIPHRWRGSYNEDTDLCLQVLADGWCTLLMNAFLVDKLTTMTVKGGNTAALYQGDGRLKMARALERLWPGVVETRRRWQRPQHVVKFNWRKFDTPLKLKTGVDRKRLKANEYNLKLTVVKQIKSKSLRKLVETL